MISSLITAAKNLRFALASSLLVKTQLWDGLPYTVPRRIGRLVKLWRSLPGLREELDTAWNAYQGGDVIDVGSYHGIYAIVLSAKAKKKARFVMLEPDPVARAELYSNIGALSALFPGIEYHVLPWPASDLSYATGLQTEITNKHLKYQSATVGANNTVRAVTLDELVKWLQIEPDLIKIDVEGAEAQVLRGGKQSLMLFRPSLAIEIHPKWLSGNDDEAWISSYLVSIGLERTALVDGSPSRREMWRRKG